MVRHIRRSDLERTHKRGDRQRNASIPDQHLRSLLTSFREWQFPTINISRMKLRAHPSGQSRWNIHQHVCHSPDEQRAAHAPSGIRHYIPAFCLLIIGIVGLSMAALSDIDANGRYIVFAAPGATLADTINLVRNADGRLVQAGRFNNIVIAGSDRPDFPTALRDAGAWLAIAAPARGGCLDPSSQKARS